MQEYEYRNPWSELKGEFINALMGLYAAPYHGYANFW
jgi:hypothetical protein